MEIPMTAVPFAEFDKISRLNREIIVTEKIDGTNGQVHIRPALNDALEMGYDTQIEIDGQSHYIRAGSRNRWVLYLGSDDNNGFGRWVHQHAHELAALGAGAHFGEWWGAGIQRKYGLTDKRWSLFNVGRWVQHDDVRGQKEPMKVAPKCCHVVPVIGVGVGFDIVYKSIERLKTEGSVAARGFLDPEGVVAFHTHSRTLFKMTIKKDTEHKWESKEKSA
jgi:hypothetical protein